MSENYVSASAKSGDHTSKLTTCGKILVNQETKIVDEEGRCVPYNTPGELWIRGYATFLHYKGQAELTAAAKTKDGWLKTG